jgi:hypothetical protein
MKSFEDTIYEWLLFALRKCSFYYCLYAKYRYARTNKSKEQVLFVLNYRLSVARVGVTQQLKLQSQYLITSPFLVALLRSSYILYI